MAPKKKREAKRSSIPRAREFPSDDRKNTGNLARKLNVESEIFVSQSAEAKLLSIIQNKKTRELPNATREECTEHEQKAYLKKVTKLYDELASFGFNDADTEEALNALPLADISLGSVLDWLCLNLENEKIPETFLPKNVEGDLAEVNVVVRSDPRMVRERVKVENASPGLVPSKKEDESLSVSLKSEQADWIRRYLSQKESDSEDESDQEVDSWEQREREEPKQEHWTKLDSTIDKLSDEEFLSVATLEWSRARSMAALAKGNKDKSTQAEAGKIMAVIKKHASSRGMDVASFATTPAQAVERQGSDPQDRVAELAADDTHSEVIEPAQADGKGVSGTEEDIEMSALFDEDEDAAPLSETFQGLVVGNLQKGHLKVKPIPEKERKPPRSLLQQLCRKHGWAGPRFAQLQCEDAAAQYCYSVTVVRPAAGFGKSKVAGGAVTLSLPPEQYSYNSIESAQSAVCTLALYSLFGASDPAILETIPAEHQAMWMAWQNSGLASHSEMDAKEKLRRERFASLLVENKTCSQGAVGREPKLSHSALPAPGKESAQSLPAAPVQGVSPYGASLESESLRSRFQEKHRTNKYRRIAEKRATLPMAAQKDALLSLLDSGHDVVVVSGATGSGKTTQVPQYILESMALRGEGEHCSVVCTQPRRIAAMSVAARVAFELCEPPAGEPGSLVGYHVRLDARRSASTRILFCTTGILLRQLLGEQSLDRVSHVIVDEVHERTLQGDFLLIILRDILHRRKQMGAPPLKIILMSATMDSSLFSAYFGGCPVVSSEGRSFPVQSHFLEEIYEMTGFRLPHDSPAALSKWLVGAKQFEPRVGSSRGRQQLLVDGFGDESTLQEGVVLNPHYDSAPLKLAPKFVLENMKRVNEEVIDFDLLEETVLFIDREHGNGAILAFLPGMGEIQVLLDRLASASQFRGHRAEWIIPLHSSAGPADQRRAFEVPPEGCRKVVLATNIAETSVTIEDVVFVVDSGKMREVKFDAAKGMSSLDEAWIARSNAEQRRGRAGRVQPGHFFALYTKQRLDQRMRPYQLPEIQRVSLVETCLQIKLLHHGAVAHTLQKAIEPPADASIKSALQTLEEVGAVDEYERLTPLGRHLAQLPVDVKIGKMLLYGAVFHCLSPILTISACLSFKSPFSSGHETRNEVQKVLSEYSSPSRPEPKSALASIASGQQSDHLTMAAAFHGWLDAKSQGGKKASSEYCKKHFLNQQSLEMLQDMRVQFAQLLSEAGLLPSAKSSRDYDDLTQPWNQSSRLPAVIKCVLVAGMYPNIASLLHPKQSAGGPVWSDGRTEVSLHPASVNFHLKDFKWPFLVFHEKMKTSKVYLRDCTLVSPASIFLFGGSLRIDHKASRVCVDDRFEMRLSARTAVLFKELRSLLMAILTQEINGSNDANMKVPSKEIISCLTEILLAEEKSQRWS